jgi:hypothetical protein
MGVLRELAEAEPRLPPDASRLVQREDATAVLVELGRELPALHLEDDPEHLDPALPAASMNSASFTNP